MVLYSFHGKGSMPDAHDDALLGSRSGVLLPDAWGPAGDLELVGERRIGASQGVVACAEDCVLDAMKETLAVVLQDARLSVHNLPHPVDGTSVRSKHALEAHANPEDGDLAGVVLDGRNGDARVLEWVARTRRDDEVGDVRVLSDNLFKGNIARSHDRDIGAVGLQA